VGEGKGVTERGETGVELLLSQPELVAWLELTEQEVVVLLEQHQHRADADTPPTAA
jgi:hypothetical protein